MVEYVIVGRGRLANHMAHYFHGLSVPFSCWGRRPPLAGPLLPRYVASLEEALRQATHVLALIRDDAIEDFLSSNRRLFQQKTLVHFSGSLVTPLAQGAHPLMTFTDQAYEIPVYERIPFVVERGRLRFEELLPALPNPHYYLDPEKKALYHALCVLSGNFTSLLWSKFFREIEEQLELPREAGYPYMEQIFMNLKNPLVDPVTGPIVRRDAATVERNLEALRNDPYRHVYEGFLTALGSKRWYCAD